MEVEGRLWVDQELRKEVEGPIGRDQLPIEC